MSDRSNSSPGAARSCKAAPQLSLNEIQQAFANSPVRYGVIVCLSEAAEITGLEESTLKRKVSEGHFKGCVRRGRPLRFWRDGLVQQFMDFGR